jgi:hypothetical protein
MDALDYKNEGARETEVSAFGNCVDSPSADDWLDYGFLDEYAVSSSTRDHLTEDSTLKNNGEKDNCRNNLPGSYEPLVTDDYLHPIHTLSFRQIVSTLNHRYPIRERDESKIFGSAWVDVDDSGDYDPNATKVTTERPKWRMRISARDYGEIEADDEADNEGLEIKPFRPKTSTYEQGRRTGRSLMVTLRFGPERREQFKALADAHLSETGGEHDSFKDQASDLPLGVKTRSQLRSDDNGQKYLIPITPLFSCLLSRFFATA